MVPKQIEFLFRNKNNNVIPRVIAYFVLISENKNNYSIGPLISDERGVINLTKELIENTIYQSQIDFPMDYSGNLNSCTHLEVLIETKKELERRSIVLKEFYPENASLLDQAIAVCNNENMSFNSKYLLPIKDKEVTVDIQ
jgi:c-di-GMP-related signal transduction protein